MTGGWAATNTLREALPNVQGLDGVQCQCVSCEAAASKHAALAVVETALNAAEVIDDELAHGEWTERSRARLYNALRAVRENPSATDEQIDRSFDAYR